MARATAAANRTKSLFVGHMDYKYLRWQVVDTPGVLDKPLEERNTIEMQSITALAHLQCCVLYVVDISEQCGYSIEQQVALFESIKPLFQGKPLVVAVNKVDVRTPEQLSAPEQAQLQKLRDSGAKVVFMSTLQEVRARWPPTCPRPPPSPTAALPHRRPAQAELERDASERLAAAHAARADAEAAAEERRAQLLSQRAEIESLRIASQERERAAREAGEQRVQEALALAEKEWKKVVVQQQVAQHRSLHAPPSTVSSSIPSAAASRASSSRTASPRAVNPRGAPLAAAATPSAAEAPAGVAPMSATMSAALPPPSSPAGAICHASPNGDPAVSPSCPAVVSPSTGMPTAACAASVSPSAASAGGCNGAPATSAEEATKVFDARGLELRSEAARLRAAQAQLASQEATRLQREAEDQVLRPTQRPDSIS